jgi:hypothetical protein
MTAVVIETRYFACNDITELSIFVSSHSPTAFGMLFFPRLGIFCILALIAFVRPSPHCLSSSWALRLRSRKSIPVPPLPFDLLFYFVFVCLALVFIILLSGIIQQICLPPLYYTSSVCLLNLCSFLLATGSSIISIIDSSLTHSFFFYLVPVTILLQLQQKNTPNKTALVCCIYRNGFPPIPFRPALLSISSGLIFDVQHFSL